MNDSILMLAAARQGDLIRAVEHDKRAGRVRAAARALTAPAAGSGARAARLPGLAAVQARPARTGR
jgi:hypothetical protein